MAHKFVDVLSGRKSKIPYLETEVAFEKSFAEYQANKWIEITGGFLDINELKDAKRIACFCKPLRCHCDYLKKQIEAKHE